jgi:hypothetical protein
MRNTNLTKAAPAPERVLVIAPLASEAASLSLELLRRGAAVTTLTAIPDAAAAARGNAYAVIVAYAREDAQAMALFLSVLKAEAKGSPRLMMLVDPDHAARYSQAAHVADEMMATTLSARRIADATGIGLDPEMHGEAGLPATPAAPRIRLLSLPGPLAEELLPNGVGAAARGEIPDAIVLTEEGGDAAISAWMSAATAAVVPIIDATGKRRDRADAVVERLTGLTIMDALEQVKPITARVKLLPDAYHRSRDANHMLLARVAVRSGEMRAVRDPHAKAVARYRDTAVIAGAMQAAEALTRAGLMERRFFDKLQCCPGCHSARLLVREECGKCRSADLVEEPIIHHLRCGYQGPERDFREGRALVCPKCRQHCEHFSVDYDKPGKMIVCNGCGHGSGDPEVGFFCMDCEDGFTADKADTRVIHDYVLTEEGRRAAFDPPVGGIGDGGDASESLKDRIRRFAARHAAAGATCAALLIKLDADGATRRQVGESRFQQAIALYASILREMFNPGVDIIEADTSFMVLLPDENPDAVETAMPELRRSLEGDLSVNLQARYHVFGADELASLL